MPDHWKQLNSNDINDVWEKREKGFDEYESRQGFASAGILTEFELKQHRDEQIDNVGLNDHQYPFSS